MSKTDTDRTIDADVREHREPEYVVDPLFVNRWSPRAMTGQSLPDEEILALFDAARWAPSAYNNQHWRFVYATREDDEWETFVDLLSDANRAWATDAAALVAIFSSATFEHDGEPAATRSFDTGAAWQNLALEGARRVLVVHAMVGFDWGRAHEALGVPEDEFDVEAMVLHGGVNSASTLGGAFVGAGTVADLSIFLAYAVPVWVVAAGVLSWFGRRTLAGRSTVTPLPG